MLTLELGAEGEKKKMQRAWCLKDKQEYLLSYYQVPSTQRGCWLLPQHVGCCGQRDWLERRAGAAVGKVRVCISQHMSHLPGLR